MEDDQQSESLRGLVPGSSPGGPIVAASAETRARGPQGRGYSSANLAPNFFADLIEKLTSPPPSAAFDSRSGSSPTGEPLRIQTH